MTDSNSRAKGSAVQRPEPRSLGAILIDDSNLLIEWFDIARAHEQNLETTNEALKKSSGELESYIAIYATSRLRQPAASFFRNCRTFDPSRAETLRIAPEF